MLKSRLTRILVLGAAAASLTGIAATGAQAVTYYTQPAGPGACYLPKDVAYAGQQASITAPSMEISNPSPSTVTVREWIFIVDAVTGARMKHYWAGDRNLAAGGVDDVSDDRTRPLLPHDFDLLLGSDPGADRGLQQRLPSVSRDVHAVRVQNLHQQRLLLEHRHGQVPVILLTRSTSPRRAIEETGQLPVSSRRCLSDLPGRAIVRVPWPAAERHRHLPVHGHRGLDQAARGVGPGPLFAGVG